MVNTVVIEDVRGTLFLHARMTYYFIYLETTSEMKTAIDKQSMPKVIPHVAGIRILLIALATLTKERCL